MQTKLLRYYYNAKQAVYSGGYFFEIYWQEKQDIELIDTKSFFSEYSWVVLSSGMRETVIRKKFNELTFIFNNWVSPQFISDNKYSIRKKALKAFNHPSKINALFFMAKYLCSVSIANEIGCILSEGVKYLEKFPYLGPATSLHFAKNLGLNVSKPDRHLVRISEKFGFDCPATFCKKISKYTGEKESVVDIVLWRYATLDKNYLSKIN
jgi:hypothetical protein